MKIGLITDIHENSGMLGHAVRQAEAMRCDELACLGDIVGFDTRFYRYHHHRSARECIRLVRKNCRWVVPGNHDLFAAHRLPLYSNGFVYPGHWFSLGAAERIRLAQGRVWCFEGDAPHDLEEEDLSFLRSLPEYLVLPAGMYPLLLSHYIYPDLTGSTTRYVERKHQLNGLWEFMDQCGVLHSFSGHSHQSMVALAYRERKYSSRSIRKALHPFPQTSFILGTEQSLILLPPLAGEKGWTGFSVLDTDKGTLEIVRCHM